ncbi:MAG: DUF4091 domain-containing protein [Candidatus Latescibacteria bacterium]|nr:DUF4091 domain-containing protein [Candidatus Latescibacterota bacterium]
MAQSAFVTRPLNSLVKVFADQELQAPPERRGSCLLGEVFSFQVAYRPTDFIDGLSVELDGELAPLAQVRAVGLVPSQLPGRLFDQHVLRTTPGLYPDPLYPLEDGLPAPPGQWRAVWVTVRVPQRGWGGKYSLEVRFVQGGAVLGREVFSLDIVPVALPRQKLIHTSWFHSDCIATQYGVETWGREHWRLLEQFVASAVDHGVNLLLTPLFTPPLDTEVGGERPTVQLVEVEKEGSTYSFNFKRLDRWVKMADKAGVRYFEMAHLFTQWGAAHCPKIIARENGRQRKIFGWADKASGTKYRNFLDQFLSALVRYIDRRGLRRRCYFHVSDEPSPQHLETFAEAAAMIRGHLKGFPFIDALSSPEFYRRGLVPHPIPASNHIEPFVELGVKNLWTYYCVSQWDQVANRFFCMPSARNRILGAQLFKYDLAGFLQWGFNFWYTQYSKRSLDPFRETDAGGAFPSGDAFLVYPGAEGPIDSLRGEVFLEGLQDQRALQLLEKLQGRPKTLALLERGLDEPITMKQYPRDEAWLLGMRARCNRAIGRLAGGAAK